jgi:hypothetical protein
MSDRRQSIEADRAVRLLEALKARDMLWRGLNTHNRDYFRMLDSETVRRLLHLRKALESETEDSQTRALDLVSELLRIWHRQ